jgi:hypothetical protein
MLFFPLTALSHNMCESIVHGPRARLVLIDTHMSTTRCHHANALANLTLCSKQFCDLCYEHTRLFTHERTYVFSDD